jgi:hypothetical protein
VTTVNKLIRHLVVLLCAALVAAGASAQESPKPGRVVTGMVKSAVIVEAVDYDKREMRVIDASGNRFTVVADDAVTNLDQIKPRDRIVTEYVESVAIVVAPEGAMELPQGAAGAISEEGEAPAITGVETFMVRASVQAINRETRRVTLMDEDGNTSRIKVADDTPLDLVDVGDEVRVRLTRAVAITVQKPDS